MKSEEIREKYFYSAIANIDGSVSVEHAHIFFLAEIAAQLAEMNERADPTFHRELAVQLGSVIKLLIAAGNEMAEELAHYFPAGKSAIDKWKAAVGQP